jgi:hypothetical protein
VSRGRCIATEVVGGMEKREKRGRGRRKGGAWLGGLEAWRLVGGGEQMDGVASHRECQLSNHLADDLGINAAFLAVSSRLPAPVPTRRKDGEGVCLLNF